MTRILIAEDSPTQAARLAADLEDHGFEVTPAPDAERAYKLFQEGVYDLVISDVVMPGMSGYELCRRIKADRSRDYVPVMLVTSLSDPMDVIHGLECGADNFLRKPFQSEDLIRRIARILDNTRLRGARRLSLGIEVAFLGNRFTITSDKEQILDLLISTFEDTVRANRELQQSKSDLAAAHARIKNYASELEDRVRERTAALTASERRFQDIAEVSGDWIWDTDGEHRYTNVGQSGMHGVAPEVLLGKTRWELAGGDPDSDAVWQQHKADLDSHRPFRNFRYSTGFRVATRLHLCASGKPVFDAAGNFLGYRGTTTNETAVVEASRRAEQAEATLRDAIESISGGILICDASDRIVLSNGYVRERAGAECAELLRAGTSYEEFMRALVAHGNYTDAIGQEEAWLALRMASHRTGCDTTEHRQIGGGWMLLSERRMTDGGITIIGIDITPIKKAHAALVASEERLDRAQAIAGIGSWEVDLATGEVYWSKEMFRIRGLPPNSTPWTIAAAAQDIVPEDRARMAEWFDRLQEGDACEAAECRIQRPDGQVRIVSFDGKTIPDRNGWVAKIAGTLCDITERRSTERQLIQAQKMEAIGNLTGGMAHDFNNLLGVIIGNIDLLRDGVKDDPELDEMASDALDAAMRGADLTRRLLAFARRQPLRPERVDVNGLVGGIARLLRRTIGQHIEIKLDLAPELWPARIDPAQLEAAITNLATNARDAMPGGGWLAITTRNGHLDANYAAAHVDVVPGDYVTIEVSDVGTGIAAENINHIFEPFFTTKDHGKGTGLGLSMVFGFVRQSGGHINVYSEVGSGTTFRLYLPKESQGAVEVVAAPVFEEPRGGGETILVVEDNAKLLTVLVKQLGELGYRLLTAENPAEALAFIERDEPIDLLLTDVVMPGGMSGIDLARAATTRCPRIRVLLTSGFPDLRFDAGEMRSADWRLLSKPYRREELARLVRESLDRATADALLVMH